MSAIQKAIQQGLKALRSPALGAQVLATYTSASTPTYNTATGVVTSPSTAYADVPVVFYAYNRREVDGETIKPEDQQALIAVLDLAVEPTLNDTITDPAGVVWTVQHVKVDPVRGAWILQVRRP